MNNSVVEWLDRTAKQYPNKNAIEDEKGAITYKEYRDKAVSLANEIISLREREGLIKFPVVVYLE